MALERVERERHTQAFAVPEEASFGGRQAQLMEVASTGRCPLHAREAAVALDERRDARVGGRLALVRCAGGGLARGVRRGLPFIPRPPRYRRASWAGGSPAPRVRWHGRRWSGR